LLVNFIIKNYRSGKIKAFPYENYFSKGGESAFTLKYNENLIYLKEKNNKKEINKKNNNNINNNKNRITYKFKIY
jgi:hypothetical protein